MAVRRRTTLARVDAPAVTRPNGVEVVSLRESAVVAMARIGALDALQVEAAFRFRNLVQSTHNEQGRAYREFIDGGEYSPSTERVTDAMKQLRRCRQLLGRHGFNLVSTVCYEGFNLTDLYPGRRQRDTAADVLRVHLTELAEMFRLSERS